MRLNLSVWRQKRQPPPYLVLTPICFSQHRRCRRCGYRYQIMNRVDVCTYFSMTTRSLLGLISEPSITSSSKSRGQICEFSRAEEVGGEWVVALNPGGVVGDQASPEKRTAATSLERRHLGSVDRRRHRVLYSYELKPSASETNKAPVDDTHPTLDPQLLFQSPSLVRTAALSN